ncbi:MAG TPA: hypothetical protein VFS21_38455 [Roseiflexaceae bacterium]|nr:hypothetical protein [Roseiflexaceae bacterium]
MAQHHLLTVADQRAATAQLFWLTLHAPELARAVRPGQYLLLRCAPPGSADPLLRRALFVAAAEEQLGQIGLLYAADERGLAWLSRARTGDTLDALGPFGTPFALDRRTRTLLLVGQGPGLAALLLLARQHSARGGSVALLAGAPEPALLPPPFLMPADVEYQSVIGRTVQLLERRPDPAPQPGKKSKGKPTAAPAAQPAVDSAGLIGWADQLCTALPSDQLEPLAEAVRAVKYRWERGFAQTLLEAPLVCGVGACGVCAVETRKGQRLCCSDGPVFDLREVIK